MALITATIAGGSGRWYNKSTPTGQFSAQASHTIMVRCKWTSATNSELQGPAYYYVTSNNSGSIIGHVASGGATQTSGWRQNGTPTRDQVNNNGGYETTTWRHYALVYDATAQLITYYIDGVSVGTVSSAPTRASTGNCGIGVGICRARTADYAVFNRALSAGEVQDMCDYRVPQVTSGLIAFYRLDTNSSGGSTEGTGITDTSGNGNTATPTGSGTAASFSTSDNPPQPETPAVDLDGGATTASTLTGALTVNKALAGAPTTASTLAGALTVNKALAGGATSASTLSGALGVAKPLAAAATTASSLAAWIRPRWGRRIIDTASANITRSMSVSKATPWTLMTWFRTVDSSDEIRVGFTANAVTLGSDSGNLRLRLLDDSATFVINYSGADDLQWHHLALTFDGTTARGYVDGTQVASSAASFSGSFVSISWDSLGGSAAADVAHTKLWSGVALSAAEIDSEADYYQPHTSTWALVAWWQLAWNAVTFDSSGNGYTLTDNGSTEAQSEAPGLPLTALAGGATTASTLAGTLSQAQPLAGGASSASTLAGTLSQAQPLAAGATTASTLAGTLSQTQPLTGAAVSASTLAGTLSQAQPLVGGASTASTLSGNLFVSVPLAAGATTASSLAGTLGLAIPIAGALSTGSTLAGALGIEGAFSGNALTTSTLSGTLSVDKPIAGAAATASTLTGILSQLQPLGAAASSSSTLAGSITVIKQCQGGASTASTLSGSLSVANALAAAASTASTLSGTLSLTQQLAAALQTASTLTGALSVQNLLVGAATTTSRLTGAINVDVIWQLSAAARTASTLTGSLTVTVPATARGRVVTRGRATAYYGPDTIVTRIRRQRQWPPRPR